MKESELTKKGIEKKRHRKKSGLTEPTTHNYQDLDLAVGHTRHQRQKK